jgi:hypothetical protein
MGTPEIVDLLYFEGLPSGSDQRPAGQSTTLNEGSQPTNETEGQEASGTKASSTVGGQTASESEAVANKIFTFAEAKRLKLVIEINRSRCPAYTKRSQLTSCSARLSQAPSEVAQRETSTGSFQTSTGLFWFWWRQGIPTISGGFPIRP